LGFVFIGQSKLRTTAPRGRLEDAIATA